MSDKDLVIRIVHNEDNHVSPFYEFDCKTTASAYPCNTLCC